MYNEILDIYRDRIDDFFKNVPTFENQLTYDDFNDEYLPWRGSFI